MFCAHKMNNKINHIHQRALRLVYEDYITLFEEFLFKDKPVSIHFRNIRNVAIEMFKVKNDLCPDFIKKLFCLVNTKTRLNASFHRPNITTVYTGERSQVIWSHSLGYYDPTRLQVNH